MRNQHDLAAAVLFKSSNTSARVHCGKTEEFTLKNRVLAVRPAINRGKLLISVGLNLTVDACMRY